MVTSPVDIRRDRFDYTSMKGGIRAVPDIRANS